MPRTQLQQQKEEGENEQLCPAQQRQQQKQHSRLRRFYEQLKRQTLEQAQLRLLHKKKLQEKNIGYGVYSSRPNQVPAFTQAFGPQRMQIKKKLQRRRQQ